MESTQNWQGNFEGNSFLESGISQSKLNELFLIYSCFTYIIRYYKISYLLVRISLLTLTVLFLFLKLSTFVVVFPMINGSFQFSAEISSCAWKWAHICQETKELLPLLSFFSRVPLIPRISRLNLRSARCLNFLGQTVSFFFAFEINKQHRILWFLSFLQGV